MSSPNLHVAVIGAGATGLLLAQGLKKANVRVSVFETLPRQTYEDNPRTWTMALHWSRRNVEQCLPPELFAALSSAHTNPWHEPSHDEAQSLPVVDGKTGEVLVAAKVDDGRRVVRRKLRDLFRRGIDVRFGYKLAGVDTSGEGVTATFENGEVVRVDVLVGADGAKSVVRDHLVDGDSKELDRVPLISTNIGCRYTAEQARFLRSKIHPIANMAVHPDQDTLFFIAVADVPDPEDPETWEFQVALSLWSNEDPPETNEDRMKYFKKLAEPYCEPYRSAALWVPDDTYIPRDKYAEWKSIAPWKNFGGRVTVAGDAAHPMCPFRGQGLNNALQDAGNLVKAITAVQEGRQTLAAAIDEYDAEVYQRGKREIEISEESMFGLHHYSAIKGSPIDRMGLKEQKA
ncbi:FAD-dependent monooxygenase cctM [Colletotrichum siamense]|nr:FAD-dependent monooxygenase cctM [Colletotrichum siamense]